MKKLAVPFLVGFIGTHSTVCAQLKIPAFEFHLSANHPFKSEKEDQTFYGGGVGANLVFRDACKLSFKTGFEANFFHTWNKSEYLGHMTGKSNVHYNFWNLSIPVMFRLKVGQKVKLFVEAGAYLGIPLTGNTISMYHSYSSYPGGTSINETRTEKFEGYFSLSPAVSLGAIFPVSQRVDLFLKPEFVFQKNFGIYDSPVSDFNDHFRYIRLCLGIRINMNDEIE